MTYDVGGDLSAETAVVNSDAPEPVLDRADWDLWLRQRLDDEGETT